MGLKKPTAKKKKIEGARQIGIATTIPFLLVSGPVVGYFFGNWLDGVFHTAPYLMILFALVGMAASGKETYKLIKMLSEDGDDADDDFRP